MTQTEKHCIITSHLVVWLCLERKQLLQNSILLKILKVGKMFIKKKRSFFKRILWFNLNFDVIHSLLIGCIFPIYICIWSSFVITKNHTTLTRLWTIKNMTGLLIMKWNWRIVNQIFVTVLAHVSFVTCI